MYCDSLFACPEVDFFDMSVSALQFMQRRRKSLIDKKHVEKVLRDKAAKEAVEAKEAAEKAKEKFEPAPSEVRPRFDSDYERFAAWLAEEESFL